MTSGNSWHLDPAEQRRPVLIRTSGGKHGGSKDFREHVTGTVEGNGESAKAKGVCRSLEVSMSRISGGAVWSNCPRTDLARAPVEKLAGATLLPLHFVLIGHLEGIKDYF
jgi:hypothetical protein